VLARVSVLRKFPNFGSSNSVVKLSYHLIMEGINGSHPPLGSTVKNGASILDVEHTFFPIPKVP
jgi:hypothetical protein